DLDHRLLSRSNIAGSKVFKPHRPAGSGTGSAGGRHHTTTSEVGDVGRKTVEVEMGGPLHSRVAGVIVGELVDEAQVPRRIVLHDPGIIGNVEGSPAEAVRGVRRTDVVDYRGPGGGQWIRRRGVGHDILSGIDVGRIRRRNGEDAQGDYRDEGQQRL